MEQNKNQNLPPTTICRKGCGFYGNEAFEGMCSKCYKEDLKRKQSSSPAGPGRISPIATMTAGEMDVVQSVSSTLAKTNLGGQSQDHSSTPSSTSSRTSSTTPSVETATTTVQMPNPAGQSTEKQGDEEGATGGAEASEQVTSPDIAKDKKKKNRCHTCKKKVGLTGFECRCGGLYCSLHRYSDKHECTFNYRELAQEQIRKNNPVIVGEKVQKI